MSVEPLPLSAEEEAGWQRRIAMDFASLFVRIRGAHAPDPGEPCAWCRLAADQAAEAVVKMATGIGMDGRLRGLLDAARVPGDRLEQGDTAGLRELVRRYIEIDDATPDVRPDDMEIGAFDLLVREWSQARADLVAALGEVEGDSE